MQDRADARDWAREEFGDASLGHRTRTDRVVQMAARAALRPSGRVSEVFTSDAERQGAYDLLENSAVRGDRLLTACAATTAKRCAEERFVHVAIDGSSLTLTDRRKAKNFGRVGSDAQGARGLKVMTAYAVSPKGVAVGLLDQQWWTRAPRRKRLSKNASRLRNMGRATRDKETQRWLDAVTTSEARLDATGARGWFQLDREGDARPILLKLCQSRHFFTIRSRTNRRLAGDGKPTYLRERLAKERLLGTYDWPSPAFVDTPNRASMRAGAIHGEAQAT